MELLRVAKIKEPKYSTGEFVLQMLEKLKSDGCKLPDIEKIEVSRTPFEAGYEMRIYRNTEPIMLENLCVVAYDYFDDK